MHSGVYDPVDDRLLIFSGLGDYATSSPAWGFNLGSNSWSRLELAEGSESFPLLNSEQVFYDAAHHRVVMADTGYSVKVFDLSARKVETAPASTWPYPHRQFPAQAYDAQRERLFSYGGLHSSTGIRSDLWVYDFRSTDTVSRWREVPQIGDLPARKFLAQAYVDPHRDVLVLFGGNWSSTYHDSEYTDEVHELDLKTLRWKRSAAPARPSRRGQFSACYDDVHRRGFIFGGLFRAGMAYENITTFNEIWSCSKSGAWSLELPRGPLCPTRRLPVAGYDSQRNRLIIYGGEEIQGSQSGARAEMKVPQNGASISGNRALVMAELVSGTSAMVRQMLFQYRQPSEPGHPSQRRVPKVNQTPTQLLPGLSIGT